VTLNRRELTHTPPGGSLWEEEGNWNYRIATIPVTIPGSIPGNYGKSHPCHWVWSRLARGDLGNSSGAQRRRVNRCPPETPRKKETADSFKQTNKRCGCTKKQTNPKKKNESRGYAPSINLKSKPLPFRNQHVMADGNHDPPD